MRVQLEDHFAHTRLSEVESDVAYLREKMSRAPITPGECKRTCDHIADIEMHLSYLKLHLENEAAKIAADMAEDEPEYIRRVEA